MPGIGRPQADGRGGRHPGRSALVGGGATGIGRAVAEQLVKSGHRVIITGRRADVLDATARRDRRGGRWWPTSPRRTRPRRSSEVDVLVLNAGGPAPGRILQVTDAQWEQAFALLVTGPLRLARRAVPAMAARGFGRVVFVTSVMVRQPQPDLAASVVLRSATTAAAKLLSRECADRGVTVNCVAPGATATARRREILEARAARDRASRSRSWRRPTPRRCRSGGRRSRTRSPRPSPSWPRTRRAS